MKVGKIEIKASCLFNELSDALQPSRPCDMAHLHSILNNLDMIVEGCGVGFEQAMPPCELEDYYCILSSTASEITRLLQYPSLFPSVPVRKAFKNELAITYARLERILNEYKAFYHECEEFLYTEAQYHESSRRPVEGCISSRTVWQNYLSKNAPGAFHSVLFPTVVGAGSVQLVPECAYAMMEEWLIDTKEILRDIDKVSELRGYFPVRTCGC